MGNTLASHFFAEVGMKFFVSYLKCPSKHDCKISLLRLARTFFCLLPELFEQTWPQAFPDLLSRRHVRVHVCLTCLWFGMLIFRPPLSCSGLADMFWFLAPLIVWHVCYPVISVMCRSCRRVLRNPDLFAWQVLVGTFNFTPKEMWMD